MGKFKFHKGLKTNLPSAGLVKDHYYQCLDTGELFLALSTTELKLVGTGNLKTINNQSLLGEGNIEIQGGGADVVKYTEQTLTDAQKEQARTNIDAASKTPVVTQSADVAIDPNKITKLGELSGSVTLTLAVGETGKASIYDIIFSTGSSVPTISWPSGISWAGGSAPTINASKNYEVSISEGLAMITEF